MRRLSPLLLAGASPLALPLAPLAAQSTNAAAPAPPAPAPDLLFVNGRVRTPGGWVEAAAVSRGIVTRVGTSAALAPLRAATTRVVDLHGRVLLPGLHDAHLHPLTGGLAQYACVLRPGAAAGQIAAAVTACAGKAPAGTWIRGGDWVASAFAPGDQTKAFLDRIVPDHPVLLSDESHHSAFVNSRALQLAGIDAATPNPSGGIIERDAQGEPTGLLRESAMALVARLIPPPDEALKRAALVLAANQMLSFGITGFTDAGVTGDYVATLAALSGEGAIKQHVRGCLRWAAPQPGQPAPGEALIATRAFYARPRFAPTCVKIVLDGVPTESHTAALVMPYEQDGDHRSGAPARGLLMVAQPVLDAAVTRFDREGLSVKFHAAGDAAVRAALDAVAAARKANGAMGPMHSIAHATFVDPADVPRARGLGVAWEFSPYIWYPTPIVEGSIRKAVGDRRLARAIPIREGLDSGALVVAGSDWSVVPSLNPWPAMETMVTRQKPGGSAQALAPREQVTLAEAFRIFTENAALEMRRRDEEGTIEPGMHADVIVVATDPFAGPITRLHETKVDQTYIDGELVYDAAHPPRLTAN